jgi:flavin-dependent dehydrogenase
MEELDVLTAMESAGFYPSRGNTVWWGDEARVESFPEGATGFQITRERLDPLLLQLASDAGATVFNDATVRGVTPLRSGAAEATRSVLDWPEDGGGIVATYEDDGMLRRAHASWVLDCSGRTGVLARRGLRQDEPGQSTLAIHATWEQRNGWDLTDPSHTLIESYEDGWAWSVPTSPTERCVAVMIDPDVTVTTATRGAAGDADALYRAELDKTTHLGALLDGATCTRAPKGLGASPYSSRKYAGPGWLLVGDAASFIDPLSSFGVKKAFASGWLAAVVVDSVLARPGMSRHALELYDRREAESYASWMQQAAVFFASAGSAHGHEFWRVRAEVRDAPIFRSAVSTEDPDVRAAFEALKGLDSIRLRPASSYRVVRTPVVKDREVVLEDSIITSWAPNGLRYLYNVDLPRLASLAPSSDTVPGLFDVYSRNVAAVGLPEFLSALSVMLARGILVDDDSANRYTSSQASIEMSRNARQL